MTKVLIITLILGMTLLVGTAAWSDNSSLQKAKELNGEVIRLYQQGHYAEAIPYAEKALTTYENILEPDPAIKNNHRSDKQNHRGGSCPPLIS